jgi:TPR repeat protein
MDMAQDLAKAAAIYRKAAEQGDAAAQYNLGIMYDHGRGVPQDYAQAALWYRKAAEQGFASAQLNLGAAYYEGQGVTQDYAQAAAWYRKAAEQGDATAQFNLGAAYCDGQGVAKDYAEAYLWLNLAASGKPEGIEVEEVVRMRDDAASHLTNDALIQAQERARRSFEEHSSASVGDNARAPRAVVSKKSRWPSVVGWVLIVIGVWGGLQKVAAGGGNLLSALVTIALFVVAGIGLIKRSGKFAAVGLASVLVLGVVAEIAFHKRAQTVTITQIVTGEGSDHGYCGMDASGKNMSAELVVTKGVVTRRSEDPAYMKGFILEDGTSDADKIFVVLNQKLTLPAVGEKVEIEGLVQCPPPGSGSFKLMHEILRFPAK